MQINALVYRSPNWSPRPSGQTIDMLVLHTGEGTKQSDLGELLNDRKPLDKRVSAHYYVDRAGKVYELVSPEREAWHAGISTWRGRASAEIRDSSIGIESEHKQGQDWPAVQRQAFFDLCRYLILRYPIQPEYVVAHRWIAPHRRDDPTDWPDAELKPWIASLFAPSAAGTYRTRTPVAIFETPTARGPIALGGMAVCIVGMHLFIDSINAAGWAHIGKDSAAYADVGFVPIGTLEGPI